MSIGKKLLSLRQQRGLSQQQLADELHVSRQTVSKWEADLSLPDMKMALTIAEYYNISINELLGLEDENPNESLQKVYEQTNVVLQNIQHENKKRSIRDFLIIGLCAICVVILTFMYYEVKNRPPTIIYESNYNNVTSNNDSIHPKWEVVQYFLDDNSLEVKVSLAEKNIQKDASAYLYLKELSGKEHKIPMLLNNTSIFEYNGMIPLCEYEEINVVSNNGDKSNSYSIGDRTNYVGLLFDQTLRLYIPYNDGKMDNDRVVFEPYGRKHAIHPYHGLLDGQIHVQITSADGNHDVLLDEIVELDENRELTLRRKVKFLEQILVSYTITYDGGKYSNSQNRKYTYGTTVHGQFDLIE